MPLCVYSCSSCCSISITCWPCCCGRQLIWKIRQRLVQTRARRKWTMLFYVVGVSFTLCYLACLNLSRCQVQEKEKSMRATEDLLSAARRLLSVTCDCCEQLTDSFDIDQPSQKALALLQIKNPEDEPHLEPCMSSLPFLQFICAEDRHRFQAFIAASNDVQAPSSLHLRMQTCTALPFEAQVFHVNVPGTLSQPQHLIGIKLAAAEMMSIPEHCTVEASPFIPASHPGPRTAPSQRSHRSACSSSAKSSKTSKSSKSEPALERETWIHRVSLAVDPSDACVVSSVHVEFQKSQRPSLLAWIGSRSKSAVEGLIQHHLNCWHHGGKSAQVCQHVKLNIPDMPSAFTAGEMSVAWIEDFEAEHDQEYPSSIHVALGSIALAARKGRNKVPDS